MVEENSLQNTSLQKPRAPWWKRYMLALGIGVAGAGYAVKETGEYAYGEYNAARLVAQDKASEPTFVDEVLKKYIAEGKTTFYFGDGRHGDPEIIKFMREQVIPALVRVSGDRPLIGFQELEKAQEYQLNNRPRFLFKDEGNHLIFLDMRDRHIPIYPIDVPFEEEVEFRELDQEINHRTGKIENYQQKYKRWEELMERRIATSNDAWVACIKEHAKPGAIMFVYAGNGHAMHKSDVDEAINAVNINIIPNWDREDPHYHHMPLDQSRFKHKEVYRDSDHLFLVPDQKSIQYKMTCLQTIKNHSRANMDDIALLLNDVVTPSMQLLINRQQGITPKPQLDILMKHYGREIAPLIAEMKLAKDSGIVLNAPQLSLVREKISTLQQKVTNTLTEEERRESVSFSVVDEACKAMMNNLDQLIHPENKTQNLQQLRNSNSIAR